MKSSPDNWLLVSFEKDVPITYRMVSERETEIDLTSGDPKKKSRPQTTTEKLELVIVYTPVVVDPFGLSILKVECESVKVTRSGFSGKKSASDAMESLTGKSFTLNLTPTGKMADISDLERIAAELGEASFSKGRQNARKSDGPERGGYLANPADDPLAGSDLPAARTNDDIYLREHRCRRSVA
ncbi:MAG: hypothetical protein ACYSOL_08915 [Planctomycetota bacterium]